MLSALITLSLLAAGGDAGPRLTRDTDRWVLQNAHVRCTFDLHRGGLLSELADAKGRVYWGGTAIYSDHGPFEDVGSVSTANCANPQMAVEEKAGEIRVVASGRLLPAAGKEIQGPFGYRVTYTLGDAPLLKVRMELSTPVDRPEVKGFLALVTSIPGAHEWMARTIDGLAVERFADARDRVWQSSDEALSPDRPEMGAVWPDGRRLMIEGIRAAGPLENAFWHQGQPGSPNLFLAFLSGTSLHAFKASEPWALEYGLRVVVP